MRLRLLGALELFDGRGAVPVPGVGQRRILSLLAIHAAGIVSASGWPTSATSRPARYGPRWHGSAASSAPRPSATEADGYMLRGVEIDTTEFERLLARARMAALAGQGHAPPRGARVRAGAALAEFAAEEWARPEAVRLTELRASAVEDSADASLRAATSEPRWRSSRFTSPSSRSGRRPGSC